MVGICICPGVLIAGPGIFRLVLYIVNLRLAPGIFALVLFFLRWHGIRRYRCRSRLNARRLKPQQSPHDILALSYLVLRQLILIIRSVAYHSIFPCLNIGFLFSSRIS